MAADAQVDRFDDAMPVRATRRFGTVRFWNPSAGAWSGVDSLAVSPDGRMVATVGRRTPLILWDLATGREVRRLGATPPRQSDDHTPEVAFAPDGSVVIVAAGDPSGRVDRWEVATGEALPPFAEGHRSSVLQLAFAGDGSVLATGDRDGVVLVRDAVSGQIRHRLGPHTGYVAVLVASADGRTVLSGGWGEFNVIVAWDATTGRMVREFENPPFDSSSNHSIALSPDGSLVAVGRGTYRIVIWDVRNGEIVAELEEAQDQEIQEEDPDEWHAQVVGLAFAPDGETLASAGRDSSVRIWDVSTWSERMRLDWRDGRAESVAFSPDGATLVAAGDAGVVRTWALPEGRERIRTATIRAAADRLAWTPDGATVVAVSRDGAVCLLDPATGEGVRRAEVLPRICYSSSISPDGRLVAYQGLLSDRRVRVVETSTGRLRQTFDLRDEDGVILVPCFSADGSTLFVSDGERYDERHLIVVYDLATGEETRRVEASAGYFNDLAVSPDDRLLATRWKAGGVFVYEFSERDPGVRLRYELDQTDEEVVDMAFSPDGSLLATASRNGFLRLWDTASGRTSRSLGTLAGGASRVAFSPDGERLAAASPKDPVVRLWDVKSGREIDRLEGHHPGVRCLAFAPDGRRLATGSFDTTVLIWRL